MIFDTVPAPIVLPPSRIANRIPSSIAIGWMSSAVEFHVIAWHHHLGACWKSHSSSNVRRTEVELRTVAGEERLMASAFFFVRT